MKFVSDSNLETPNKLVKMLALLPYVRTYYKDINVVFYQIINFGFCK